MSKLATSRSAQTIRVLIVMFEDIIPNVVLSNGVVCLLWLSYGWCSSTVCVPSSTVRETKFYLPKSHVFPYFVYVCFLLGRSVG